MRWWNYLIAAGMIVFGYMYLTAAPSDEGLTIGNISSTDGRISFNIANTGDRSGDVLFWVFQNGFDQCEAVAEIEPGTRYTGVKFYCPTLRSGQFDLQFSWADHNDATHGKANVASRIQMR